MPIDTFAHICKFIRFNGTLRNMFLALHADANKGYIIFQHFASCGLVSLDSYQKHIAWMKKLRSICIYYGITDDTISIIQECKNLCVLTLTSPVLTTTNVLRNHQYLWSLSLGMCPSLMDISSLSNMKNILKLSINGCGLINDFSPLKNLISLKSLKIGGDYTTKSQATTLTCLNSLMNLTNLSISHFEQLHDLDGLSNLLNLSNLLIFDCDNLQNLKSLSYLHSIIELSIAYCPVLTDISPLQYLYKLQTLRLQHCQTLLCKKPIVNLTTLKTLHLRGTPNQTLDILKLLSTSTPALRIYPTWLQRSLKFIN